MQPDFSQLRERLNDRRFAVTTNTQGLSGSGTVFHYRVEGDAITGTYQGGRIRTGQQIGRVTGSSAQIRQEVVRGTGSAGFPLPRGKSSR